MSGTTLHGNIYNSFECDFVSFLLERIKLNSTQDKYTGQIGYDEDKIDIKFIYDTKSNTVFNKTKYRYCMSLDDVTNHNSNVFTDSMSDKPDNDIFACFCFTKENKLIPISDIFNNIFSNKVTIILDRDYSR